MEKQAKFGYPPQSLHAPPQKTRQMDFLRSRPGVKYAFAVLVLYIVALWHIQTRGNKVADERVWSTFTDTQDSLRVDEYKVPLEAHIMSKCPDALDCLQDLLVPAMAQTFSKVNLTLSYIGTATDDGVSCMHGPTECLGNILELCAANIYPDPKIYLGFTLCLSKRFPEIPGRELVHDCALEHGIDFDKLNDCASKDDGAYGMGLLKDSVQRSSDVGAKISCTIRLADEVRCVRDGGDWKDCKKGNKVQDLVQDIEKLWAKNNED